MTTRPLLCLVTDRRRLAAALERPLADAPALLLDQIAGAASGGIDYVQIRERDLDGGELLWLVAAAVRAVERTGVRILVNDRADVALAASAHGVHLRETSFAAAAVRRLKQDWMVGRSVHSVEGAATAGAVDYLFAGTAFPSASKPAATPALGPAGLSAIVEAAHGTPVLAIGGITTQHAGRIAWARAAGIAAIGAFIPERVPRKLADAVEDLVKNIRLGFDSGWTVP